MGFMIHPSNPVSIYVGASFSSRDADTAKIGTWPLSFAISDKEISFSNSRISRVDCNSVDDRHLLQISLILIKSNERKNVPEYP